MTLLSQVAMHLAHSVVFSKAAHLMPWMMGLGGMGLFGVAVIDSSMLPIPLPGSTDLLLLLFTTHSGVSPAFVTSMVVWAIAGSTAGAYLTWETGRKGGIATLDRIVPKRPLQRILRWSERNGTLTVAVAALLPPPIPLLPFVLAAGALGVPRRAFLLSFSVARTVRFGLIGWLGLTFGRQVVGFWQRSLHTWTTPIICLYFSLLLPGVAYAIWRLVKTHRKTSEKKPVLTGTQS